MIAPWKLLRKNLERVRSWKVSSLQVKILEQNYEIATYKFNHLPSYWMRELWKNQEESLNSSYLISLCRWDSWALLFCRSPSGALKNNGIQVSDTVPVPIWVDMIHPTTVLRVHLLPHTFIKYLGGTRVIQSFSEGCTLKEKYSLPLGKCPLSKENIEISISKPQDSFC